MKYSNRMEQGNSGNEIDENKRRKPKNRIRGSGYERTKRIEKMDIREIRRKKIEKCIQS